MNDLKRTPLYDSHRLLNGRIVPFAGWEMPVQYSGIVPEHHAVRNGCGIFDVSHMGEIFIEGNDAEEAVQYLTCNDVLKLKDGDAQYSAVLQADGGIVDDVIVYRFTRYKYMVCVNASNVENVYRHFLAFKDGYSSQITDRSDKYGQIALQGPLAARVASSVPGFESLADIKYFSFREIMLHDVPVICARTGYTGEDGFEFFVPSESTVYLWQLLIESGKATPCGLGARDSLRLEAAYPLYGHELSRDLIPAECGLAWIVKLGKEFVGKDALLRKNPEVVKKLIGFELTDPGIARHEDKVYSESGELIGVVTSGTKTPTINKSIGMAIIHKNFSEPGIELDFEVRGRKLKGKVVKLPFYSESRP